MPGLLAAFMNPSTDDEAGSNAWYDEERVPNRLAVAGFSAAGATEPLRTTGHDIWRSRISKAWMFSTAERISG